MAVTYVGAGAVAGLGGSAGTTFDVTGPAVQANDSLFCASISLLAGGPIPALISGGWTPKVSFAVGGNRVAQLFYRNAGAEDSEKTYTATKGSAATECHAVIFAFRGANRIHPIDNAGFKTALSASSAETVTFTAIDPVLATVHIVAVALYFQNETDFSTPPSGFDLHLDAEGSSGVGATFAVASLAGDGSSVTPGNWASNSTTDGLWGSIVFALDTSEPSSSGSLFNRRRRRQS